MMRTLQKPRKNRPSKRQVNHRRFLHNMIQRKFADIEAANHRLASALYFKDEEKNVSALQSQKPEADSPSQSSQLQDPEKCSVHTDAGGISKSRTDISIDSHQTEVSEENHSDLQHLWKQHPKSHPTTCTTRKNNQGKGRKKKQVEFTSISSPKGTDYYQGAELFHSEYYDGESPSKSINNLSEDTQTALQNSNFIPSGQNMDMSPPFSPELSPLSLDSCDFSIQMFTDNSTCTQAQKSIADIAESPWTDIMDLFSVGSKDLGGCMDVEAYFESICGRQGDGGQEVGADDLTFAEQSDSFTERMHRSEVEDLDCERGEYRYEYGYSCHGNQGLTMNHAAETQFNNFKPSEGSDICQNQLPTSISCHYNVSHLQTYQRAEEDRRCMTVNCDNDLNFTPFEGVAQSFSVPLHNPEHRPIPTPPHEDDWLFTDILKDGKSPDCFFPAGVILNVCGNK
ncbi:uncharacterized protein LOC111652207 [Seriola lalandi dorsalis]|uniref:uncharacterized protein LOC111652207 n=1 Tax=Seriola lalandi dorsalis TaxID=1841481 RepID=UPI000C6F4859|nr:uncharacterized protein LOC111652207 [Seriola lalandi dorsalis]